MTYLDYQATTPLAPEALAAMLPWLERQHANPHSAHREGRAARAVVELARDKVAAMLPAGGAVSFTGGATEALNWAIKGATGPIVTLATEHAAVLDTVEAERRAGRTVTILPVGTDGEVDLDQARQAIAPGTGLVAAMLVNNEIGVIQPIAEIGEICRAKGIIFHCDAVQAAGKIDIDLAKLKVDLLTVTAHKVYGPKGIGALYVRRKPRIRIEAQIHGGGHERGLRSGTLPTHQIVGLGEAFRIAKLEMGAESERIRSLRDRLLAGFKDMEEVYVNGNLEHRIPGNLNISFNFVEGESLIMAIKDVAVSSGSACTSASLEPSYVLRALGRSDELAHSSIRFTIGRFTTEEEIDYAIKLLRAKIGKLRELSPLWEMYKEGVDLNTVQWAAH